MGGQRLCIAPAAEYTHVAIYMTHLGRFVLAIDHERNL